MSAVVGISTNFQTVENGKFIGMERIYVNRDYCDAVLKAGGIPLLIPPSGNAECLRKYAELCDAFILSGGGDVNPLLFGEQPHPHLQAIHTELDNAQIGLTREILSTRKPLLAICRGAQLLNITLGGTLWQDIDEIGSSVILHSQIAPRADRTHTVNILPDSIPGKLLGHTLSVNSFHHQAVKKTGQNLRVVATAPDGIVEAIQLDTHPFVVGIQWHPEMLLSRTEDMLPLFTELIKG